MIYWLFDHMNPLFAVFMLCPIIAVVLTWIVHRLLHAIVGYKT
ncbi:hypothetical protein MHB43_05050 [Paenibacillus sp. FSL H8-0317]|nr:hypothetical protein [Paenibacillus xylanexedens]